MGANESCEAMTGANHSNIRDPRCREWYTQVHRMLRIGLLGGTDLDHVTALKKYIDAECTNEHDRVLLRALADCMIEYYLAHPEVLPAFPSGPPSRDETSDDNPTTMPTGHPTATYDGSSPVTSTDHPPTTSTDHRVPLGRLLARTLTDTVRKSQRGRWLSARSPPDAQAVMSIGLYYTFLQAVDCVSLDDIYETMRSPHRGTPSVPTKLLVELGMRSFVRKVREVNTELPGMHHQNSKHLLELISEAWDSLVSDATLDLVARMTQVSTR